MGWVRPFFFFFFVALKKNLDKMNTEINWKRKKNFSITTHRRCTCYIVLFNLKWKHCTSIKTAKALCQKKINKKYRAFGWKSQTKLLAPWWWLVNICPKKKKFLDDRDEQQQQQKKHPG